MTQPKYIKFEGSFKRKKILTQWSYFEEASNRKHQEDKAIEQLNIYFTDVLL